MHPTTRRSAVRSARSTDPYRSVRIPRAGGSRHKSGGRQCRLLVGDVFLETTLHSLKVSNGKITVSVYNAETLEGYQIKGTAMYLTEGAVVENFKKAVETMFHGAATAKGALVITPEKIIVTTPAQRIKRCCKAPFLFENTVREVRHPSRGSAYPARGTRRRQPTVASFL